MFFVLKGDVVEMKENNSRKILQINNINEENDPKDKDLIARISSAMDRETRMSTIFELSFNPEQEEVVTQFLRSNAGKLKIQSIRQINQLNNKENEDEEKDANNMKNIIDTNENKEKTNQDLMNVYEQNKCSKILIIVDQDDINGFKQNFSEQMDNVDFKEVAEFNAIDLDRDKQVAELKLTSYERKLIKRLNSKKFWILKTMSKEEQVEFIDELIKLADDNYNKKREKLLERHSLPEYRYFLNLIFNSGCLTFDALSKLADFVSKCEISHESFTSVYEEGKTTWDNVLQDLGYRDISGKRDRLRVMIGPEFQAKIIAYHIKLFDYLRNNKKYDEKQLKKYYRTAIQIAKDEYSKASREFWSSFLLYVVGLSFLITLAGAIVTALVGLSGFAALAPCAVLLVTTLIKAGSKFHTDYKIWPWDWVYWWKDAKANCLKVLQSDYMQEVLIDGNTETLNKEIRNKEVKVKVKVKEGDMLNDHAGDKITELKLEKKGAKSERKLYRFLFRLCMVILAVSVMIAFFPSVVATAIPLVLSVFELEVAFTIAPLVSGIFLWIAMAAMIAAVVFSVMQSDCCGKYQQLKFDTYKEYIEPDSIGRLNDQNKYFMKLNGKHQFYTKEDLEAAGINVEVDDKKEIT